MATYLSINECISNNIIELSNRQIKRRIDNILNDINDNRVIYQFRKGIKTIVLKLEYALTVNRNRKPKIVQTSTNEIESIYTNNLIKTEITIAFNEEFDSERLKCIVEFYKSDFPIFYQTEGRTKNKKHLHLGVSESIEGAKTLICESLKTNGIELVNTNIKISQIANIKAYEEYLHKFGNINFKNFSYTKLSEEYKQHCYKYNFENQQSTGLISNFGKDYFENRVFDYKKKLSKGYQF